MNCHQRRATSNYIAKSVQNRTAKVTVPDAPWESKPMNQDDLDTLIAVRKQIRRINQAAMRSIFNPEATEALEKLIKKVEDQINLADSAKPS